MTNIIVKERRVGDWGCTSSGRRFYPEDPRHEDIIIEDIAHALSLQCRYGGHCLKHYSVAQHSVLVSRLCPPEDALWGLLHDAAEAYIIDIPRPLKKAPWMHGYRELEKRWMAVICEVFDLPLERPESVSKADEAILPLEAAAVMPKLGPASPQHWTFREPPPTDFDLIPWSDRLSRRLYLETFYKLAR